MCEWISGSVLREKKVQFAFIQWHRFLAECDINSCWTEASFFCFHLNNGLLCCSLSQCTVFLSLPLCHPIVLILVLMVLMIVAGMEDGALVSILAVPSCIPYFIIVHMLFCSWFFCRVCHNDDFKVKSPKILPYPNAVSILHFSWAKVSGGSLRMELNSPRITRAVCDFELLQIVTCRCIKKSSPLLSQVREHSYCEKWVNKYIINCSLYIHKISMHFLSGSLFSPIFFFSTPLHPFFLPVPFQYFILGIVPFQSFSSFIVMWHHVPYLPGPCPLLFEKFLSMYLCQKKIILLAN